MSFGELETHNICGLVLFERRQIFLWCVSHCPEKLILLSCVLSSDISCDLSRQKNLTPKEKKPQKSTSLVSSFLRVKKEELTDIPQLAGDQIEERRERGKYDDMCRAA